MLVGGEVGHDVEGTMRVEQFREHRFAEVDRIGDEVGRDPVIAFAAKVADQFGESVLVVVDDAQLGDVEPEHRLDVVRADRTGTADHQRPFAIQLGVQLGRILAEIFRQQAVLSPSDFLADEPFQIKIDAHGDGSYANAKGQ